MSLPHASYSVTFLSLFLLLVISLTTAIPTLTHSLLPRNFSASSITTTPPPPNAAFVCTDSDAWLAPFYGRDCMRAFDRFQYEDVLRYGHKRFQFHDRSARPRFDRPSRCLTPRRYTIGKCTVAIVLIDSFPEEYFPEPKPERPTGGWVKTEVATFIELFDTLGLVGVNCLPTTKPAGWARRGATGGLGVFVWATDSDVDKAVEGYTSNHAALGGDATDWKEWAINEGLVNETGTA